MNHQVEKFCASCGQELKLRDLPEFNRFTGERAQERFCANTPTCQRACGESPAGHDYKFRWFYSNQCKKCGGYEPEHYFF